MSNWMKTIMLVLFCTLTGASIAQSSCLVRTPGLQGSYVGDCISGIANGRGKASGRDGYEGEFRDGQPHGRGLYVFADGRRFDGEFAQGRVSGKARFTYANGDILEGEFRDNLLIGAGRLQRAGGQVLQVQIGQRGELVVMGPATGPNPPAATPTSDAPPGSGSGSSAGAAVPWAPQLDFEDLFPSYIFASATRKPPKAPNEGASRSADADRGDPLARIEAAQFVRAKYGTAPAQSRYIGNAGQATYVGDPWGLIGIRFSNKAAGTQVMVRVAIDEVAEPTEANFTLPAPGEYMLYPKIRYRYDRLRAVAQSTPVNVTWAVEINGRSAGQRSAVTRVRSIQDVPLAIATKAGVERLLWVFAGFVTEDAPWIDEIIREAFAGMPHGALGYQVDADGVEKQVEAVYQSLRRRGLKYSSILQSPGASEVVHSQIVRFPSDSIRTSQANCVDGTVLIASILRKMGIEPIIVTGPGHAIVGYFRAMPQQGKNVDVRFIETTMLGSADYAAAAKRGWAQFEEWERKASKDPRFQVMPVIASRNEGVMPIPR